MYANPTFGSTTSLDYAELAPARHRAGRQPDRRPCASASRATAAPPGPRPRTAAGRHHRRRHASRSTPTAPRCVWSPERRGGASHSADGGATWTPAAGLPAGARGRVRPGRPARVLRLRRRDASTSAPTAARRSRPPPRPACPPRATCGSRPCPGSPATSGWPAARPAACTGCGAPPTAAPRSPGWPAWTRPTTSASARPAPRRRYPAAVHQRQGRRRARHLPLRRRRAPLDPDQRRPAPVGLDRRGHHRRPARLRPGLRGHQRPRHHRRRTALTCMNPRHRMRIAGRHDRYRIDPACGGGVFRTCQISGKRHTSPAVWRVSPAERATMISCEA